MIMASCFTDLNLANDFPYQALRTSFQASKEAAPVGKAVASKHPPVMASQSWNYHPTTCKWSVKHNHQKKKVFYDLVLPTKHICMIIYNVYTDHPQRSLTHTYIYIYTYACPQILCLGDLLCLVTDQVNPMN